MPTNATSAQEPDASTTEQPTTNEIDGNEHHKHNRDREERIASSEDGDGR